MVTYDAVVVGLGAMGSAALYHLAGQGARALGIDRFAPPHPYGSTHGDTRITRQAVGEGPAYVPLVLRSYELWRDLERETGRDLLSITGGLIMGSAGGASAHHGRIDFLERTMAVAREFHIPHATLDTAEIRRRFPQFALAGDEIGYFEEPAGFLRPEACVAAHLAVAARRRAEIRTGETVTAVVPEAGGGVTVQTDSGTHSAGTAILAAGPWLPSLLDDAYAPLFAVYRQVLYWYDVKEGIEQYLPGTFPIFIWLRDDGDIYGFPAIDGPRGGVKVATEVYHETTTPEQVAREVGSEETQAMYREHVAGTIPGLSERCVKAASCLYTVTPDSHFVIDRHPHHPQVILASPCSGHGFKHSPAIGEGVAQWVSGREPEIDLSAFSLAQALRT